MHAKGRKFTVGTGNWGWASGMVGLRQSDDSGHEFLQPTGLPSAHVDPIKAQRRLGTGSDPVSESLPATSLGVSAAAALGDRLRATRILGDTLQGSGRLVGGGS